MSAPWRRSQTRRTRKLIGVIAAASVLVMSGGLAYASDVAESIVDTTTPTTKVTLSPGASGAIALNLTISGKQDGTATFKVYRDWILSGGSFTGSNPETFTVLPQPAGTLTHLSTTGTVSIASGQADGTFTLAAKAFDVTNSNTSGAKLGVGDPSNYAVTVQTPVSTDTTAPVLTLPSDFTAEATGPSGAVVTYTASATDAVDGNLPVACAPASGSTFALGATAVSCSASDSHGNTATGAFNVTVVDTTEPTLADVPGDMTVEATGPSGAVVTFGGASATDLVDGSVTPTYSPTSGSTFALGTTTVTVSATDNAGNTASDTFDVTIQDTTAPTLSVPSDMTVQATSASGATVTYIATASDLVDGAVTPVCAPASGSTFAPGTTTVTCSATDAAANSSTGSFKVTVSFAWNGFFAPVNNGGVLNTIKGGQSVPLKWSISDGNGGWISSLGVVNSVKQWTFACDAGAPTDEVEAPTSGQTSLRYDATAQQYIYNWQSPKISNTCYKVTVNFADGTARSALFKTK